MTRKTVVARRFMAFVIVELPLQRAISPFFRKILVEHLEAAGAVAQITDGWSRYDLVEQMIPLKEDARLDEGSRLLVANYHLSFARTARR